MLTCFFIIFSFVAVRTDFVSVNWNLSSRVEEPHPEREYEHPMYENIAPVPCDLTDSCDLFCPLDPDCTEFQRMTFSSYLKDKPCGEPLSHSSCDCDEFDKPEHLNWLCFVRKNPIYLGKFYKTPKKIESVSSLKHLVRNLDMGKVWKNLDYETVGSSIMTYAPSTSESFPSLAPLSIQVPFKDSSFACKTNPVRYRTNQTTVCHTEVSEESCENGYSLSIIPYLVGDSSESKNPVIVKDLNYLKGLETEVRISCIESRESIRKVRKHERKYFQMGEVKPCREMKTYSTYILNNTCHNVLMFVKYKFTLNGSELVKVQADYGITNVLYETNKYNYIKQIFQVGFIDVGVNEVKNVSRNDVLYNRGYLMGEKLNFGYTHIINSTAHWERGVLGVFKNGDSCSSVSPVEFGLNYNSVCFVREKLSNCSQLRATVEFILGNLIKGESLATHANLRPPYNNTVPVLRNYPNSTSICSIPIVQTVLIQYTTKNTPDGIIHRAVGMRIDREYNKTVILGDFRLTARVMHIYVSSYKTKQLSRFWRKMYSAEQSETSWVNLLNAFEDVRINEREEIRFWFTFSVFFSLGVFSFVKLSAYL